MRSDEKEAKSGVQNKRKEERRMEMVRENRSTMFRQRDGLLGELIATETHLLS